MKHYIVEARHLVTADELPLPLVGDHRKYLQRCYDEGHFLFSGPQVQPHEGFFVVRAESREALDKLLAEEPFVQHKLMEFTRITEFDASWSQPFLKSWFGK